MIRGQFKKYIVDLLEELDDVPEVEGYECTVLENGPVYYIFLNDEWTLKSDVISYSEVDNFPSIGQINKTYIANNTNTNYRWTGSGYVQVGAGSGGSGSGSDATIDFGQRIVGSESMDFGLRV